MSVHLHFLEKEKRQAEFHPRLWTVPSEWLDLVCVLYFSHIFCCRLPVRSRSNNPGSHNKGSYHFSDPWNGCFYKLQPESGRTLHQGHLMHDIHHEACRKVFPKNLMQPYRKSVYCKVPGFLYKSSLKGLQKKVSATEKDLFIII